MTTKEAVTRVHQNERLVGRLVWLEHSRNGEEAVAEARHAMAFMSVRVVSSGTRSSSRARQELQCLSDDSRVRRFPFPGCRVTANCCGLT